MNNDPAKNHNAKFGSCIKISWGSDSSAIFFPIVIADSVALNLTSDAINLVFWYKYTAPDPTKLNRVIGRIFFNFDRVPSELSGEIMIYFFANL